MMENKLIKFAMSALWLPVAMSGLASESLPWTETFASPETWGAFTVIDANHDGNVWEHNGYNQLARIRYNEELDMDDWLITPGFALEAGRKYKFSLDAKSHMGAERFEVMAGTAPNVAAMTKTVIARTDVTKTSYQTFSGEFSPSVSGIYYIGIHGCSDPFRLYLDIDNLALSQGMSGASPAAVSGLTAVADATGLPKVDISFTLPTTDADGNQLSAIDKVEIYCDATVATTITGRHPGNDVTWSHENAPNGQHTYKVIAYSGSERGVEAEAEVFVGPRKPARVTGFKAEEIEDGLVKLTWDVPLDENGNQINPALVTYKVVQNVPFSGSLFTEEDIEGADAITECTFTHRAVDGGGAQAYTSYGVYASTAAGRSPVVKLPLFPVGKSYVAPWQESFADGSFGSLMRSETVNYYQVATSWDIYTDAAIADVQSVDGDNGFIVMGGADQGDCARLYSGKIDISGLVSPALTFYLYNPGGNIANNNLVEVFACRDGGGFSFAGGTSVSSLPAPGWNRVTIPLTDYAGSTVQFAIQGTIESHNTIIIDDLRIASRVERDLAASNLTVPGNIVAGVPFKVSVMVENHGSRLASDWSLTLNRDNVAVAEVSGPTISAGTTRVIEVDDCISVLNNEGSVEYTAVISYAEDGNPGNDSTDAVEVLFGLPAHPVPVSLTGANSEGVVSLSWTAPDLSSALPDAIVDSFEDYAPFAKSDIGEWTMVDADKSQSGRLADIIFPGINDNDGGGQSAAFWIMDATYENLAGKNATFAPASGDKCLVQIFNYGDAPCDDWAISPELYGGSQTISFYARAYSQFIDEDMQVLYSDGGTDIADFKPVATEKVANSWTRYEYLLPDGAAYFAIRCLTEGGYMLMIDDVRFIPEHGTSTIELAGYNVYRDGVRLTETPVAETTYTDRPATVGSHDYHVTAVYDRGESLPAGALTLNIDKVGIDGVSGSAVGICAFNGEIRVTGAAGKDVEVYSPDGRLVASAADGADARIAVGSGMYLVKTAGICRKVNVH